MKKIIFSLIAVFVLSLSQAYAINLDKIAVAVDAVANQKSDQKGGKKQSAAALLGVDDGLNKIFDKVEARIAKYEEKLDKYDKKIDQVEKSIDRATSAINSFDPAQIQKYLALAKTIAIAVAIVFGILILLLVLVFIQLLRVSALLKKK